MAAKLYLLAVGHYFSSNKCFTFLPDIIEAILLLNSLGQNIVFEAVERLHKDWLQFSYHKFWSKDKYFTV